MSNIVEAKQSAGYNFIAFSQTPEYIQANYELLKIALEYLPTSFTHVDVATGTGLVPSLVARLCEEEGKSGFVLGIEPDEFALKSAREAVRDTDHCRFEFVKGYAQQTEAAAALVMPGDGANLVTIHDAIHEIYELKEKRAAFGSMAHTLALGGVMSYNSAFTTVAMRESAMGYGRWKGKAFAILEGRRNKDAPGMPYHSPDDYLEMMTSAITESGGIPKVVHEDPRVVPLSRKALEGISQYPAFVIGFFTDMINTEKVSLADKSAALIKALDEGNITSLPRVWHEAIVQKQAA